MHVMTSVRRCSDSPSRSIATCGRCGAIRIIYSRRRNGQIWNGLWRDHVTGRARPSCESAVV